MSEVKSLWQGLHTGAGLLEACPGRTVATPVQRGQKMSPHDQQWRDEQVASDRDSRPEQPQAERGGKKQSHQFPSNQNHDR